jgi:uncharacterized membrane protein YqaE (UPF0057 family)
MMEQQPGPRLRRTPARGAGSSGAPLPVEEEQLFGIQPLPPLAVFKRVGTVPTNSYTACLDFALDISPLEKLFQQLQEEAEELDKTSVPGGDQVPNDWSHRVRRLRGRLDGLTDILQSLTLESDTGPDKRTVMGAANLLLGLFNTWRGHKTQQRVSHSQAAIRATVLKVDVLQEMMAAQDKEQSRLQTLALSQGRILLRSSWQSRWNRLEDAVMTTELVVAAGLQHSLHPAINQLADVRAAWKSLQKSLGSEDWNVAEMKLLNLYQLQASLRIRGGVMHLTLEVPVVKTSTTFLDLYQLQSQPLLHEGKVYYVWAAEEYVAVDDRGDQYMVFAERDFMHFRTAGRVWYPLLPGVQRHQTGQTCVDALWFRQWTSMKEICWLKELPSDSVAWATGPRTFALYVSKPVNLMVTCAGQLVASRIISGAHTVHLKDGCAATTRDWGFTAGSGPVQDDISVLVDIAGSVFDKPVTEVPLLQRPPTEVQYNYTKLTSEVEDILGQQTGFSLGVWIAIGMGAAAMLLMVIFVAFLYYRARKAWEPVSQAMAMAGVKVKAAGEPEEEET